MAALPHRVRRLVIEARTAAPGGALALHREVKDGLATALIPALERAFDALDAGSEVVHLKRLVVAARVAEGDDPVAAVARAIEAQIAAQVREAREASKGGEGIEAQVRGGGEGVSGSAREQSVSDPTGGGLFEYLARGALPWALAGLPAAEGVALLREAAVAAVEGDLSRAEPEPFAARAAFFFRWLDLLPEERWPVLARTMGAGQRGETGLLAAAPGASVAEIVAALSRPSAAGLSRHARQWLAAAIVAFARSGGRADVRELALLVARALSTASNGPLGEAVSRDEGRSGSSESPDRGGAPADRASPEGRQGLSETADPGGDAADAASPEERPFLLAVARIAEVPEPARAALRGLFEARRIAGATPGAGERRGLGESKAGAADRGATPQKNTPERQTPSRREAPQALSTPGQTRPLTPGAPAAEIARSTPVPGADARTAPLGASVHHAGLVLLHPYLARFFEGTGVKRAGVAAISEEALPRAAALLSYLATGEDAPFEGALGFVKVLLGLRVDSDLPVATGLLGTSDLEEADALLAAVIGHWNALKSTSPKGLRGAFLQRGGLLREDENGLRLRVETAPWDMLLGRLPWGIGIVRLPWMRKALFTEWPTP